MEKNEPRFKQGDNVILRGLNDVQYNERQGTVTKVVTKDDVVRVGVRLSDKKVIAVPVTNVQHFPVAPDRSVAPPPGQVPVLFVPEIHMDMGIMRRNREVISSYIREKQEEGVNRICFVSEGNSVNPVFDSLIAEVGPNNSSSAVDYTKKNLLVESLNSEQYLLDSTRETITTLPTTMNPLVDFIAQFFQDYGALVYQMGDPNTVEGIRQGMAKQGLNNVDIWFHEGNTPMIQHLIESRHNLLNDEGNVAADDAIAILQNFKGGGLQGFYGESGDNYTTSIGILVQLLELIKIMILNSKDNSFDYAGKLLLPQFIDKIKHGLETGIVNPAKMADETDGLNAWMAIYLPNQRGENARKIKPFMQLILSARDDNIINAMIARLDSPDPPQVFVMIFGAGHYPSIEKKLKDNPYLVLDPQSKNLFNSMGGKKTRRRRKGNKKKKTKKRRTKRHKTRRRKKRRKKRRRPR